MRIRTIKPEFWISENVGKCSRDARLFFIGLWSVADDSGKARADSRMLARTLLPYDEDAAKLAEGWLVELEKRGCIKRYVVDGSHYLIIPCWAKHQKIDHPSKSTLPDYREDSPKAREDSPKVSGGNGMDGNGEEGSGGERISHAQPAAHSLKTTEVTHGDTPAMPPGYAPPGIVRPPTVEECQQEADRCGGTADQGREFFEYWSRCNWADKHRNPISHNWRAKLMSRIQDQKAGRGRTEKGTDGFAIGQKYHEEGPLVFTTPDGTKVTA